MVEDISNEGFIEIGHIRFVATFLSNQTKVFREAVQPFENEYKDWFKFKRFEPVTFDTYKFFHWINCKNAFKRVNDLFNRVVEEVALELFTTGAVVDQNRSEFMKNVSKLPSTYKVRIHHAAPKALEQALMVFSCAAQLLETSTQFSHGGNDGEEEEIETLDR